MRRRSSRLAVLVALIAGPTLAMAQTEFTYQGQLKDGGSVADGTYDFLFRLYDAPLAGAQVGATVPVDDWQVSAGLFTAQVDFGVGAFTGDPRWLEIDVRDRGSAGAYTTLAPRQPLTAAPYALYALSAPGGGSGFWDSVGDHIRSNNNGNVGVGTTPSYKLHVRQSVPVGLGQPAATFGLHWSQNSIPLIEDWLSFRVGGSFLIPVGQEGTHIIRKSGEKLHFSVEETRNSGDLTPQLTIHDNGNVGLGTTTPQSALHVLGAENNGTNAAVRIVSGSQELLMDGNEIDTLTSVGLYLNNNVPHRIVLANGGGNVGIGMTAPTARLHVQASGTQEAVRAIAGDPNGFAGAFIGAGFLGSGRALFVSGESHLFGPVGVGTGTVPAGVSMAVDGKVLCEEVEVQLSGDWPDYVFADDYQLMPLSEVGEFVRRERHLPDIPPADEIKREGLTVGRMQADVVRKLEELTLHMIELNEQVQALKQENASLRTQIAVMPESGR
jgi:hypothetical protein